MNSTLFLLLAALPIGAIWAQTGMPNGQGPGPHYCGHVIDAGTFIDARARNASGEEAVLIRWLDGKTNAVHSALFMGRCLAKDGDTIDGKIISRVLPNSLAVSEKHAFTGWEAEYRESYGPLGLGPSKRGVFNDNRFVAELDASKASEAGSASGEPDFRWNDQETLTLKPGLVLPPPSANKYGSYDTKGGQSGSAQAPAGGAKPCTPQPPQGPSAKIHAPKKPSAWACKTLGICVDDKPVVVNGEGGCPSAPAGPPAK